VRILFTGASSFTGSWFVRELAARGHEVVATMTQRSEDYEGLRGERVRRIEQSAHVRYGCSFGSPKMDALIGSGAWDVLCHHGARVGDYQSPDFDVLAAVGANTRNLPSVLARLVERGCRCVILTGSFFERGEGAGLDDRPALSPYGLSKAVTADLVRFYANRAGTSLGKFVIPNPFGPWEEPRFTSYLAHSWLAGEIPTVSAPAYVRDNIHVSLLTLAYVAFVESLPDDGRLHRVNPSGYRETQGAFARRMARELEPRLGIACPVELAEQVEFSEPRVRVNTDDLDREALGWSEKVAWDELADWYQKALLRRS
jgi:nucleoside-diphosphate-sugar epimerase